MEKALNVQHFDLRNEYKEKSRKSENSVRDFDRPLPVLSHYALRRR